MKRLITRRTAGKLGLAALAAPAFSTTVIGQTAPIKIGSSMAMTGGLGPNGKSALLAHQDLGRGHQRQGRAARPQGAADLPRRPDQSDHHPRHLLAAARRREGRPDHGRLRHQHAGAGDAAGHAAQEAVHRAARSRREHRVQLSELFRDDPLRAGSEAVVHQGLHRSGDEAEPAADDGRHRGGRRRVRAECRRRRARERQEGTD